MPWSLHYIITVDSMWNVRKAMITDHDGRELKIQVDQSSTWTINGMRHPDLRGRRDLDLEASSVTNTIPIHRLALGIGEQGESAAVYIRTFGLNVEQLDQTYYRLPSNEKEILFDYTSPRFGYHDTLVFGQDGLVQEYPGIAKRFSIVN